MVDKDGFEISPKYVLVPGQVICIRCEDVPAELATHGTVADADASAVAAESISRDGISPIAEWTQPVQEIHQPPEGHHRVLNDKQIVV